MELDFDFYTGNLTYKGIKFTFIFDKHELKLIPPSDKVREVGKWFYEELDNGMFVDTGKLLYIESDYLEGVCNETVNKVVFIPNKTSIGRINDSLIISVHSYILYLINMKEKISVMRFYGSNIDNVYPVNKAVSDFSFDDNGALSFNTKPIDDSKSEAQSFVINDKMVNVSFIIARQFKRVNPNPIKLFSVMSFNFEETDDFIFMNRLFHSAEIFLQYLHYRKNVGISEITLCTINDKSQMLECAQFFLCDNDGDNEKGEGDRVILQSYMGGQEGKLFQALVDNNIYTRHIPKNYADFRVFNAARIIMITAAFEWEFSQLFPDAEIRSDKRVEAESEAEKALSLLVNESTGELKKIYKHLKSCVKDNTLECRIVFAYKAMENVFKIFGEHLYSMNDIKFNCNEIAKRLSEQRNNFAHGKLNKQFSKVSLLDIMWLERMVYVMQLRRLGLPDRNIQLAINRLFACHLAL